MRHPDRGRAPVVWALCMLVLLLGLLRGGLLLVHEPLVGLANNFDMIRVQGCIDAYPVREASIPPWHNSWQAPLPRYSFRDDFDAGCFLTSEALFAFAGLPLMRWQAARSADGSFSLRVVGAVKFVALAALAILLVFIQLRSSQRTLAVLGHALIVALVLFDPGVTVFLNTFYAEFAAVFFTYAAVASIALARGQQGPSLWLCGLIALFILLACLSKIQHMLIGTVVLAALLVSARFGVARVSRRLILAVAVGAAAGLVVQLFHMQADRSTSIRHANLTNTVLATVLPVSDDAQRTAATLGLPIECAAHSGKSWYDPGVQESHPCPELLELSRINFLKLAVMEPLVVVRIYLGAVERARPWVHQVWGLVAGGEQIRLPAQFFTLSDAIQLLSLPVFAGLLLLPCVLCSVACFSSWRRRVDPGLAFVLVFTALFPPIALGVVVFGDGYTSPSQQFHLGMSTLLVFWAVALLCLVAACAARRSRRERIAARPDASSGSG